MIRSRLLAIVVHRRFSVCGAGRAVRSRHPPKAATRDTPSIAPTTATCGSMAAPARCRSAIAAPAGWHCQPVPDERSALEAEIARLQGDNAALKKELLSRKPAAAGRHASGPAGPQVQRAAPATSG